MNVSRSPRKLIGISAITAFIFSFVLLTGLFAPSVQAQVTTSNKFIHANVDYTTGLVTVYVPPINSAPKQLSFYNKSYATFAIGNVYYTNNDVIAPFPANARHLTNGVTIKVVDTVRTTWTQSGVDIIQDVYPVAFTKSGQIVYKWKFFNHPGNGQVNVQCQYLQDIQITDPDSKQQPNSNDGPTMLTRYTYKPAWEYFPSASNPASWFYIGFLYDIPNNPSFDPGLSAMGYLDYGSPLNLIKPTTMVVGDWYTMASTIFGVGAWPSNGTSYGSGQIDNAVLTIFAPTGVAAGKTVEAGRTSYGTGEYEKCVGTLFSVVFYPHHFVWSKTPIPGHYIPDSIHVEKFVVDANQSTSAPNTKITLTVGDSLYITDSVGINNITRSQTVPKTGSGTFIGAGGVGYFDWWVRVKPKLFCTGSVLDTLKFTGTCGICPPAFLDPITGADLCDLPIIVDCADADLDPPIYTVTNDSSLWLYNKKYVDVHDDRASDDGLKSITWVAECQPDSASNFNITVAPAVAPCYNDKAHHTVTIEQIDSTKGCCFEFTFTDCIGHISTSHICFPAHPTHPHYDTLPPVFTFIKRSGSYDTTLACPNYRLDSVQVTDSRIYDKGICSLDTIPGSVKNMLFVRDQFASGDPTVRFSVHVLDSMKDGNLCVRATDCAPTPSHYVDTCFYYCTIKDILAPRVTVTKDLTKAGHWHVDVEENAPWDRGIDSIYIVPPTSAANITPLNIPRSNYSLGALSYAFEVYSNDTTLVSNFCVEATDLAGNRSASNTACGSQGVGRDSLCPNLVVTPDPKTNPTSVIVAVNDIHYLDPPANTQLYVWDTGVDSVWATNNTGMLAPALPISGKGAMTIPPFKVSVADTTQIDSIACVTIHARDKKGNECTTTYCYPYTPDSKPPVIKLWYNPLDKSQILGVVTDSTLFDRGLKSVVTSNESNLTILSLTTLNGTKVLDLGNPTVQLTRANMDQSTTGTLTAVDLWGSTPPYSAITHTASVNFNIWVQDFHMPKAIIPDQGTIFSVPVWFKQNKNDNFPVSRKNITDFTFSFTMTALTAGDLNSITFDHVSTANPATTNWTLTPTVNGPTVTITGTMVPNGSPLTAVLSSDTSDVLVMLYFKSAPDQATRQVTLIVDSISFNKGRDTLYSGTSATALMPPPYGNLSGVNIVVSGACSPKIGSDNLHPSSVSLDPPHPNPFSHVTTFNYTVAEDGPVHFAIYDELGKEVARIVSQDQKQGNYTITFDASSLSGGTYIARLQSAGTVLSRRIGVEK